MLNYNRKLHFFLVIMKFIIKFATKKENDEY